MDKLTVAIQAGGKSSRMGTDKSFVLLDGRPMIELVRDKVVGLGDELILVTNRPDEYAYMGLPMHTDVIPDQGSLGGIYTAVYVATHPHTLVVACDMPWLNRDLLHYMINLCHEADVIVPRWEKYPEPLHAIYSKNCLAPMAENIQVSELKITRFLSKVTVRFVERGEIERFDEHGRSFANINTPQELEEVSGNQ